MNEIELYPYIDVIVGGRMNKMIEYRVMHNCYDGKGDYSYGVVDNLVKAIEVKKYVEDEVLQGKGVAWIQVRKVTEWKNIKIK